MSLRNLIRSDAARLLSDEEAFSEEIVIRPAGGTERTVRAIVYRRPLTKQTEDRGRSTSAPLELEVGKSDWRSPAVGDAVKVAPTEQAAALWMKVSEVVPRGVGEDCGMHLLGIGR